MHPPFQLPLDPYHYLAAHVDNMICDQQHLWWMRFCERSYPSQEGKCEDEVSVSGL